MRGLFWRGYLFKPKLRRMEWSGIILGKGIGLHGSVEKPVLSPVHYGWLI